MSDALHTDDDRRREMVALRERLLDVVYDQDRWHYEVPVDEIVDMILAEIEVAGFVVVDRERWERVCRSARCQLQNEKEYYGKGVAIWTPVPKLKLRPGDLNPIEPVEGQR